MAEGAETGENADGVSIIAQSQSTALYLQVRKLRLSKARIETHGIGFPCAGFYNLNLL